MQSTKPKLKSPSNFSASVVSCSMVRPLLVVEENCQLSTSATWSHVPTGGLVKKFTFCANTKKQKTKKPHNLNTTFNKTKCPYCFFIALTSLPHTHQGVLFYLRVVSEHVVPQNGSPGVGHLANI